jgi:hypothetical protein
MDGGALSEEKGDAADDNCAQGGGDVRDDNRCELHGLAPVVRFDARIMEKQGAAQQRIATK